MESEKIGAVVQLSLQQDASPDHKFVSPRARMQAPSQFRLPGPGRDWDGGRARRCDFGGSAAWLRFLGGDGNWETVGSSFLSRFEIQGRRAPGARSHHRTRDGKRRPQRMYAGWRPREQDR
jgi:hypothetical protein